MDFTVRIGESVFKGEGGQRKRMGHPPPRVGAHAFSLLPCARGCGGRLREREVGNESLAVGRAAGESAGTKSSDTKTVSGSFVEAARSPKTARVA